MLADLLDGGAYLRGRMLDLLWRGAERLRPVAKLALIVRVNAVVVGRALFERRLLPTQMRTSREQIRSVGHASALKRKKY
jgi:hypothetical protein